MTDYFLSHDYPYKKTVYLISKRDAILF
jgi:hypothetical protein